MPTKLTDKQKRFCDEYLANGMNATQAAIAAGYSEKTAGQIGEQNLKKLEIAEYLGQRQNKVAQKLEITQERVIVELARIAFGDVANIFDEDGQLKPIHEIQEGARAAIAGIETTEENQAVAEETFKSVRVRKVKQWDKLKALDMLSKHLGLYEKDNSQKNAAFDLSGLSPAEKLQFLQLLTKANSSA